MTAVEFEQATDDQTARAGGVEREWTPNLKLEYGMIVLGGLMLLCAIMIGLASIR